MSTPLKIIREKLKITQTELAALMNTTQATISRMEAGQWEPNASQVQAVLEKSNNLGIDLSIDDFVLTNHSTKTTNGSYKDISGELPFNHRHLLGIQNLSANDINFILDLSNNYAERNRNADRKISLLNVKKVIKLFI